MTVSTSRRPRARWVVAALVVWGLLLAGLGVWSYRDDAPTVREQRSAADAAPLVRTTVGDLVAAAGDAAVPVIEPIRMRPGCDITPVRDGAEIDATVRFYAPVDAVSALLPKVAAALPAHYDARASAKVLRADAGEFVAVNGRPTGPGLVQVAVTTGCRPLPDGFVLEQPLMGLPVDGAPERVLAALGATSVESGERELVGGCPGGGPTATTTAIGRGSALKPFASAGGPAVVETADTYAYRADGLAYVLSRVGDDGVRVAATLTCAS